MKELQNNCIDTIKCRLSSYLKGVSIRNNRIVYPERLSGEPLYLVYFDREEPSDVTYDDLGMEVRAYEISEAEKELFNLRSEWIAIRSSQDGGLEKSFMSEAEWEDFAEKCARQMTF